jgi:hypothetical protein
MVPIFIVLTQLYRRACRGLLLCTKTIGTTPYFNSSLHVNPNSGKLFDHGGDCGPPLLGGFSPAEMKPAQPRSIADRVSFELRCMIYVTCARWKCTTSILYLNGRFIAVAVWRASSLACALSVLVSSTDHSLTLKSRHIPIAPLGLPTDTARSGECTLQLQ